jgi:hypothetical protein
VRLAAASWIAVAVSAGRQDVAADARVGHFGVEFGGQLVEVGGVVSVLVGVVAHLLGFGAEYRPPFLHVVGLVGVEGWFGVQVPPFAALSGTERLGPFSTGRAGVGLGVAAGDQDLLYLACV